MAAPVTEGFKNNCFDSLVVVGSYPASVERSASVDDGDLVSAFVPEHFDAVS